MRDFGNRTPRPIPAYNREVEETPLRWGASQDGMQGEIAPSPDHSNAPTSPGMGLMSEIDLSSPLNYGTPSSLGSVRTPRSGIRGTPVRMRPDVRYAIVIFLDNV